MNTIDRINGKVIIGKYADYKREKLIDNTLINDDIRKTIIAYIDDTEILFKRNFITLDESMMRIALAEHYALAEN